MAKSFSAEDLEFCRIYGAQSRDFYGNIPWEMGVPRLQQGWFRVRGSCVIDWPDAEPHVRDGWDGQGGSGSEASSGEADASPDL